MKCVDEHEMRIKNKNSPKIMDILNIRGENMDIIYNKIKDKAILDSEIIRDIEDAKRKDPDFDINWCNENNYRGNPFLMRYLGCTLLVSAVHCNREELIEYILADPDIDVNHKSCDGYTALHYASDSILKLFLDRRDIDVNIQTIIGWTRLHILCIYGYKTSVRELLLDARVNPSISDRWERTARDNAILYGHFGIANMLKRTGLTFLLRISNRALLHDITRMIIEEYM